MVCHKGKTKVVGVNTVNGTHIGVSACEELLAVNEIYVFVACRTGIVVALEDYLSALLGIGVVSVIGASDEYVGQGRILCSYSLVDVKMSVSQMLDGGSVVVVVRNEYRHRKSRHIFRDGGLALGIARKAKTYVVCVKTTADHVLINVSGT